MRRRHSGNATLVAIVLTVIASLIVVFVITRCTPTTPPAPATQEARPAETATKSSGTQQARTSADSPHAGAPVSSGGDSGTASGGVSKSPLGTRGSDGSAGGGDGTSRQLPEEDLKGKIRFEGRWIEAAIEQRREELLARRAWAELADHVARTRRDAGRLGGFADRHTAVAVLADGTFLVTGVISDGKDLREDIVAEVRRDPAGGWKVVQANGKDVP